jgi:hypothetical protein
MNFIRGIPTEIKVRVTLIAIVIFFGALLSACSEPKSERTASGWQDISPVFRTMYQYLGGADILGPAISQLIEENGIKVQFTRAAKLEFNEKETPENRFRLVPIGVELGFVEPPITPATPGDETLCKGHRTAPMFLAIYKKLGREFVGCPITELRFNPQRNRYEQYFENLGFYRLKDTESVHTLDWGWLACNDICINTPIEEVEPLSAADPGYMDVHFQLHPVFKEFAQRLGTDFTGFALSDAYLSQDGKLEQIMERLVLIANSADNPESVTFRPLSREFHLPIASPTLFQQIDGYKFYRTQDEKGYEIPDEVWVYIQNHGGITVTGAPITHLNTEENQLYSQCFENLCLYYNLSGSGMPRVYPMPLGYVYKTFVNPPEKSLNEQVVTPSDPKDRLTFHVWESMESIRTDQHQEIGIIATENGQPKSGIQPILIIYMPDGSHFNVSLSPTGEDGKTGVSLPTLQAPNGSLINYEICDEIVSNKLFCIGESFVIWDNP